METGCIRPEAAYSERILEKWMCMHQFWQGILQKSLVAQGVVKDYIEVRLGYKIGSGKPMVLDFEASGSTLDRIGLDELVRKNFPLDRDDAVSELRLNDPNLVLLTATEGWFGNDQFPWEKIRTLH